MALSLTLLLANLNKLPNEKSATSNFLAASPMTNREVKSTIRTATATRISPNLSSQYFKRVVYGAFPNLGGTLTV